jgi:hypothetical protein
MAVAVEMTFEGSTLAQYDEVMGMMGLHQGGPTPPGAISHWVAQTDDGLRIVDVWETKEAYETFAAEQIGPFSQAAGFPGPPEITYYEVHNYLTAQPS